MQFWIIPQFLLFINPAFSSEGLGSGSQISKSIIFQV